ncbi:MAG: glycoside hydrolase family 3 [Alphaproteobacteria bacterium]|nr:glycoside hydrolase family 3 [Alphaproteobacteria bacterium]
MNKWIKFLIIIAVAVGIAAGIRCWRQHQLSNMVGQMILVGFRGTSPDDAAVKGLAADIKAGKIGGVILFSVDVEQGRAAGFSGDELRAQIKSRNIIDVGQVKKLNEFLSDAARNNGRPPLFVSIDQEGGMVERLKSEHGWNFPMPSAKEQSKLSMAEIATLYDGLGQRLRGLGFNVNFAPVVDVDVNPASPAIGARGRAFSADPERVSEYGRSAAQGLSAAGVLSSFKHFPGHGSAGADTHDGLTDITNTWQPYELEPYGDVPAYTMVMVAHVVNGKIDPDYPASLSHKTIDGVLRGQLGFRGVVISDDLQMGAIYEHYGLTETLRMAIMAGNDILLLGNNLQYTENLGRLAHKEVMKMVRSGKIPRARIKESYYRVMKMKEILE